MNGDHAGTDSPIAEAGGSSAVVPPPNHPAQSDTDASLALSIESFIAKCDASVRLWNCVKRDRILAQSSVADALADEGAFREMCRRVPSMGSKTIDELVGLLKSDGQDCIATAAQPEPAPVATVEPEWATNSLRDAVQDVDVSARLERAINMGLLDGMVVRDFLEQTDSYRKLFKNELGLGSKTQEELSLRLQEYVDKKQRSEVAILEDHRPSWTPDEIRVQARHAIDALEDKQRDVIDKRYGLNGHGRHTLNDIAQQAYVTRERVRQVESKALRRLGGRRFLWLFERLLDAEGDALWHSLSRGSHAIRDGDLGKNSLDADALLLLAADVVHDGLRSWLALKAENNGGAWLLKSADAASMTEKLEAIRAGVAELRTPTPLSTLANHIGESVASLQPALEHASTPRIIDGYVLDGYVGARARRTVALHRLAARSFDSVFDLASLVHLFKESEGDDGTSRNVSIAAEDAPHLFAHLFEGFYVSLGAAEIAPAQRIPYEWSPIQDTFEQGSIADWLFNRLKNRGPARLQDLRKEAQAAFDDEISESSIGAILASNPSFRRVAPGVFDIYGAQARCFPDGKPLDVLLDERHCRLYCHARRSGAPRDFFAAWGPWYEMHLAEWARAAANDDLYRSLLAVCDTTDWPTLDDWRDIKSTHARWCLPSERRSPLGRRLPHPDQFFSALAYVSIFGSIGWIEANRTTGAKLDNHDAADTLALLALSGCVDAPAEWQAPHVKMPPTDEFLRAACGERHERGELSWESGVMANLMNAAGRRQDSAGWIAEDEFALALASWRSGVVAPGGAFDPRRPPEPIDADQLFSSDEWSNIFNG